MPRRPLHPNLDQATYVPLAHIAAALGMSVDELKKFLDRNGHLLSLCRRSRIGMRNRYPVVWIEEIRQLTGQSYEEADPQSDWLARYIQEGPNATT